MTKDDIKMDAQKLKASLSAAKAEEQRKSPKPAEAKEEETPEKAKAKAEEKPKGKEEAKKSGSKKDEAKKEGKNAKGGKPKGPEPPGKKKKKEEEEKPKVILERVYTIPLRDAWKAPYRVRTQKAVRVLKSFLLRHMKADRVKLNADLNDALWVRGIEHPPRRVKVKAVKTDDMVVTAELMGGKAAAAELKKK